LAPPLERFRKLELHSSRKRSRLSWFTGTLANIANHRAPLNRYKQIRNPEQYRPYMIGDAGIRGRPKRWKHFSAKSQLNGRGRGKTGTPTIQGSGSAREGL